MANDMNSIFGNNNMNIDPNQRIAINNAQIQRNNAQIGNLGGNNGYIPSNTYGNGGYINNGFFNQQQQPQFLKCRPVTSIEEARAAQIDLDGSLWVFMDVGHGKVYTKQIRNDGTSAFGVYNYIGEDEGGNGYNNLTNYVTKDELNASINTTVQYILNMLPKQEQQSNNAAAADIKNDKTNSLSF